jgi:hypothetical protein
MSTFPGYFKQYRLHVGETYLVCDGSRIRKAKLIRTTERGFNFEIVKTGKNMFKKHLYPLEFVRDNVPELTFNIIGGVTIDNKI